MLDEDQKAGILARHKANHYDAICDAYVPGWEEAAAAEIAALEADEPKSKSKPKAKAKPADDGAEG